MFDDNATLDSLVTEAAELAIQIGETRDKAVRLTLLRDEMTRWEQDDSWDSLMSEAEAILAKYR